MRKISVLICIGFAIFTSAYVNAANLQIDQEMDIALSLKQIMDANEKLDAVVKQIVACDEAAKETFIACESLDAMVNFIRRNQNGCIRLLSVSKLNEIKSDLTSARALATEFLSSFPKQSNTIKNKWLKPGNESRKAVLLMLCAALESGDNAAAVRYLDLYRALPIKGEDGPAGELANVLQRANVSDPQLREKLRAWCFQEAFQSTYTSFDGGRYCLQATLPLAGLLSATATVKEIVPEALPSVSKEQAVTALPRKEEKPVKGEIPKEMGLKDEAQRVRQRVEGKGPQEKESSSASQKEKNDNRPVKAMQVKSDSKGWFAGLIATLSGDGTKKVGTLSRDAVMTSLLNAPDQLEEKRLVVPVGGEDYVRYSYTSQEVSIERRTRSKKAFNFAYNARKRADLLREKSMTAYDEMMYILKIGSEKVREKFSNRGGDYFGKSDFLDVMMEFKNDGSGEVKLPKIDNAFEGLFQDYNVNISQALDSLRTAQTANPNAAGVLMFEAKIRKSIGQDSLALDLFERAMSHFDFDELLDEDIYNIDSLVADNVNFYRLYYRNSEYLPLLRQDHLNGLETNDKLKLVQKFRRAYATETFIKLVKNLQNSDYKLTDPKPYFDFVEVFIQENDSSGAFGFIKALNEELGGNGSSKRDNFGENDAWPKLVTNYVRSRNGYLSTKPGGWRGTSIKVVSDIASDMYSDGRIKVKFYKKGGESSRFEDFVVNIRDLGRGNNAVGSYMSLYYPYKTDYIKLDSTYVISLPTGDYGYDISIDIENFKVIKQRMPFQLVVFGGRETSHRVTGNLEFVVGGTEVREKLPKSDRINISSKGELEYCPIMEKQDELGEIVEYVDGDMKPYELKSGRVSGQFNVEINTSTRDKDIELRLAEISNRSSVNNDARRMALSTMAMLAVVVVVAP